MACDPGSVTHSDAAPHRDYSLDTGAARHDSLFKDEVERRIRKAANLMVAADKLAPYDRRTFNPALVLW